MYHQPTTIEEALHLKQEWGSSAAFLAGGTDLVVGARKGRRTIKRIIDLSRVEALDSVSEEQGLLRIGAMCRLAALENSPIEALRAACATVGGPQIRNLGTIGGQLGTASPAGDVSVALIALNAKVELSTSTATRRMPLADFFLAPGKTKLSDNEIISAVHVPTDRKSLFYKIGKRDAVAISLVMGAVSIGPEGDTCIGLGCVAPVPFRATKAETYLAQVQTLNEASISKAAQLAADETCPISDHRAGADYRRAMALTLTKRMLIQLVSVNP